MARLRVPIIATVIGEGGSGGALAIAVGDAVLMLQYSTYSVISPEGCASILWRDSTMAPDAADALGITASRLKTLGLIDKIVPEPLGGAHRDPQVTAQALKKALAETLKQLRAMKPKELVETRLERLMSHGKFKEASER
jgi:acetyl-CoA carboxylase carboxyl transferase subunit alpha